MYFFYDQPTPGYQVMAGGAEAVGDAPSVVSLICNDWLGVFGGILAMLGVVAAPITSGDTAFRSARLIIADFLHIEQKSLNRRLLVCIPMFAAAIALLVWQMADAKGFNTIWNWFGWSNQTLSVFTLWAITVYLVRQQKKYVVTLVPAFFMTVVCSTFLLISNQALGLSADIAYMGSLVVFVVAATWFFTWRQKVKGQSSSK